MTSQSGTKAKLSPTEIARASAKRNRSAKARATTKVSSNAFAMINEDSKLSPDDKVKRMQALLTVENPEENVAALESWKAEIQEQIKAENQEIIALTDNEVFSNLQSVIDDMYTGVINFEDLLMPLTTIVSSLATMRANGVTNDIIVECLREKEAQKERDDQIATLEHSITENTQRKGYLTRKNIDHKNDRALGFLWQNPSAKSSQEANEVEIAALDVKISSMQSEIDSIRAIQPEPSEFTEYVDERTAIMDLLTLSSEDHVERQSKLIGAANDFVTTSDDRMKDLLGGFSRVIKQYDNLDNSTFKHNNTYTIIGEAEKGALKTNRSRLTRLDTKIKNAKDAENPDSMLIMQLETQKKELSTALTAMDKSHTDTGVVKSELVTSQANIEQMTAATKSEHSKASRIQSSGIAMISSSLAGTLTAVNRAATSESSAAATMAIGRMKDTAQKVLSGEMISSAMEHTERAKQVEEAISGIEALAEIMDASTEITKDGLLDQKEAVSRLEETVKSFKTSMSEGRTIKSGATGEVEG